MKQSSKLKTNLIFKRKLKSRIKSPVKSKVKSRVKSKPRMLLHTVATYNMSFAGDAGLDPSRDDVYESEGSFHLSNKSGDRRLFWKNAFTNIVKEFWENKDKDNYPSVMGLQEINKTNFDTGSGFIESELKKINKNIRVLTEEINSGKSKPALCCIWDSKKMGELVQYKIEKLNYIPELELDYADKKVPDQGRPILMVYTSFGYLLVVLHAPNDDGLAKRNFLDLQNNLNIKINNFVSGLHITKDKIFIMGDFNDKYDSIRKLTISKYVLSYNGKSPTSCCHNWNSSCSDSRFLIIKDLPGREDRNDIGTCIVPKDSEAKEYSLVGSGKRYLMEDEGNINNYRYYGDKVFGYYPIGPIQIFRKFLHVNKNGYYSQESDHEMVISTFLTKL